MGKKKPPVGAGAINKGQEAAALPAGGWSSGGFMSTAGPLLGVASLSRWALKSFYASEAEIPPGEVFPPEYGQQGQGATEQTLITDIKEPQEIKLDLWSGSVEAQTSGHEKLFELFKSLEAGGVTLAYHNPGYIALLAVGLGSLVGVYSYGGSLKDHIKRHWANYWGLGVCVNDSRPGGGRRSSWWYFGLHVNGP